MPVIADIKIESRQHFYPPRLSSDLAMLRSSNNGSEFGETKMKMLVNELHALSDVAELP